MEHQHRCNIQCSCCSPLWKSFLPVGVTLPAPQKAQKSGTASPGRRLTVIRGKSDTAIITMKNRQPGYVQSMVVEGDTIVFTGTYADSEAYLNSRPDKGGPRIRFRELKDGETVVPGLIEPHLHIIPTSVFNLFIDAGPFDGQELARGYSRAHVLDRLRKGAGKTGSWILGRNVDPSLFDTGASNRIDAAVLDQVSRTRPVFVMNASMHLAYVNSVAITELGLDKAGQGILAEADQIGPVLARIIKQYGGDTDDFREKISRSTDKILATASRRGVTMVFDAGVEPPDGQSTVNQPEYLRAKALDRNCPVRIGGALIVFEAADFKTRIDNRFFPGHRDNHFFLPFVKVVSDGSNQGLTGYQYRTYCCDDGYQHDSPDNRYDNTNHGIFNFDTPQDFQRVITAAVNRGWPLMVHANGDQAISRTLAAMKRAGIDGGARDVRRDRLEHASLLSDRHLEEMRECGISPSFLIGHVGYWGWAFQQRILGRERAGNLDRCRSALDYGLKFTCHSDNSVSPLGPLRMMEQSISRQMEAAPDDVENKVLNQNERVTPFEALRAVTLDAAWQCHADHMAGSLEAGKLADFAILEESPLDYTGPRSDNPVAGMRDIKVLETWKGGTAVHLSGDLTSR